MKPNCIERLEPEGMLVYNRQYYITIRFNKKETKQLYGIKNFPKDLSAPEIVHMEISNDCNFNCPECYVKKEGKELSTKEWKRIIKDLAANKVFQVTFGGGEPTLRKDLIELASYAKAVGLNTAMTTNGSLLWQYTKKDLRNFDQVNVSFHVDAGVLFPKALGHLKNLNIPRGINFTLTKQAARRTWEMIRMAKEYDAELLFLTYKPVKGDWNNQVPPEVVFDLAKWFAEEMKIKVAVDGMTCNKCMMKVRFVDIDSVGNVLPCSFVREPLGNILTKSFKEIWKGRGEQVKCPYNKGGSECLSVL